jgi:hypothetical protein
LSGLEGTYAVPLTGPAIYSTWETRPAARRHRPSSLDAEAVGAGRVRLEPGQARALGAKAEALRLLLASEIQASRTREPVLRESVVRPGAGLGAPTRLNGAMTETFRFSVAKG